MRIDRRLIVEEEEQGEGEEKGKSEHQGVKLIKLCYMYIQDSNTKPSFCIINMYQQKSPRFAKTYNKNHRDYREKWEQRQNTQRHHQQYILRIVKI